MTQSSPKPFESWLSKDAISFDPDSIESLNQGVDQLAVALADAEIVGLGEPMHGETAFLMIRNRLFQRLVEAHGYSAIAIESSFPRSHLVNEYVEGRGPASYDDVRDEGFSHGFGPYAPNRELVEWMRGYNSDSAPRVKLRFYGFDSPTEMMMTDSPRNLLHFVLDYLARFESEEAEECRVRIGALLGEDSDWENPAAAMDPTQAVGLSAAATALRLEAEDLVSQLRVHRPEFVIASGQDAFRETLRYAELARQMLDYHAGLASTSENRIAELLGLRDLMMADNLAYIVERERGRGKVLAFAHNSHLKFGQAHWQLGPHGLAWWPAGAQLHEMFGSRYVVIGSCIGSSEQNAIGAPEEGTLESLLISGPGLARFIPTQQGRRFAQGEIESLTVRSGSTRNSTYFPLTPQSVTDFDWLMVLDRMA
jgi:erythromycin esterase